MRLSTEMLAVTGDAHEEKGLGRRPLFLLSEKELPLAYEQDAHMSIYTGLDDTYAHAHADAYSDSNADVYDTAAGPYYEAHAYTDAGVNLA